MGKTPGVELLIERFDKTWAEPIFNNRNKITRRFLNHPAKPDFLLMIDDDVIPFDNTAILVHADKDVIGCPAKCRQVGRAINWVAYVESKIEEGYIPVDFEMVDDTVDLLAVDVVGSGCIMIKRRVLEAIKAPWTIEMNEFGEATYGTDFAFCRRAKAAGFEIFTTPKMVCEHIKPIGLLDIQSYDDSDGRDVIAGKYNIPWGEFAISQRDWHFMRDIIKENDIEKILEFGSGLSSLLMSELAEVTSYEMDATVMENVSDRINGNRLNLQHWNGVDIDDVEEYDLAFVDGPLGKINGGPGRQHSIRLASMLAKRVIVHDAGRRDETRWQEKYLKGNFRLAKRNGYHQQRCQYWVKRDATE